MTAPLHANHVRNPSLNNSAVAVREILRRPFRCAICGQRYRTCGARERCMDRHGDEFAKMLGIS